MRYFDEHLCMMNSYRLLTGKETYEEIIDQDDSPAFIFDPTKPVISMKDDVFDVLIDYFVDLEEYEKCSELKQTKTINSYYNLPSPLAVYKKEKLASHSDENPSGKNTSNL